MNPLYFLPPPIPQVHISATTPTASVAIPPTGPLSPVPTPTPTPLPAPQVTGLPVSVGSNLGHIPACLEVLDPHLSPGGQAACPGPHQGCSYACPHTVPRTLGMVTCCLAHSLTIPSGLRGPPTLLPPRHPCCLLHRNPGALTSPQMTGNEICTDPPSQVLQVKLLYLY